MIFKFEFFTFFPQDLAIIGTERSSKLFDIKESRPLKFSDENMATPNFQDSWSSPKTSEQREKVFRAAPN